MYYVSSHCLLTADSVVLHLPDVIVKMQDSPLYCARAFTEDADK